MPQDYRDIVDSVDGTDIPIRIHVAHALCAQIVIPLPPKPLAFPPHAQRNLFRRRDVR